MSASERRPMEELTPEEAGYLAELAELQINDLVETGVKPRTEVTPEEAEEIRILATAVEKLRMIIDPRVG